MKTSSDHTSLSCSGSNHQNNIKHKLIFNTRRATNNNNNVLKQTQINTEISIDMQWTNMRVIALPNKYKQK